MAQWGTNRGRRRTQEERVRPTRIYIKADLHGFCQSADLQFDHEV